MLCVLEETKINYMEEGIAFENKFCQAKTYYSLKTLLHFYLNVSVK